MENPKDTSCNVCFIAILEEMSVNHMCIDSCFYPDPIICAQSDGFPPESFSAS